MQALVNASVAFDVSQAQIEKVVEALNVSDIGFTRITDQKYLWTVLEGLAHIAVQAEDPALAARVSQLCRYYARGVESALGLTSAVCIGITASAVEKDRNERFVSIAKLVEFFSFAELSEDECAELLHVLSTLCEVAPAIFPFLTKSMTALKTHRLGRPATGSPMGLS